LIALLALTACSIAPGTKTKTVAPSAPVAPLKVKLWPAGTPGVQHSGAFGSVDETGRYVFVSDPWMDVYRPTNAGRKRRPAIIAVPGGAYVHLVRVKGTDATAKALVPKGFVVIALSYRTATAADPATSTSGAQLAAALADGKRAVRLARLHAK